jgi:hypothetical protein
MSGARILGMITIMGHPPMEALGNLVETVPSECCVGVLGTITPGIAAALIVGAIKRAAGTLSGVSVLF